jgi:hypothetical protein
VGLLGIGRTFILLCAALSCQVFAIGHYQVTCISTLYLEVVLRVDGERIEWPPHSLETFEEPPFVFELV